MRDTQIHTAIEDSERFLVVCGSVKIAKRHRAVADGGNKFAFVQGFSAALLTCQLSPKMLLNPNILRGLRLICGCICRR